VPTPTRNFTEALAIEEFDPCRNLLANAIAMSELAILAPTPGIKFGSHFYLVSLVITYEGRKA